MLPPFCALVAVENAWPRAGATPKQPIMGCSGGVKSSRPFGGSRSRTVPVLPPISQTTRCGAGRSGIAAGSSTVKARGDKVQPVARLGVGDLVGIETGGVDRIGHQRIAVGDPQARLGGADHVEIAGGMEAVRSH